MKLPAPLLAVALFVGSCSGPTAVPVLSSAPPVPSFSSAMTPAHPAVEVTPPSLAVAPYTVPSRVTGRQRPACFTRAHGMLPDPACTPGSVGLDPNKPGVRAVVCSVGFQERHRPSGTERAKTAAMAAYHVPAADRPRTEYDHLVPLSLGGSNDVTNLWPQVSDLPNAGVRNSKDKVENHVLGAVCGTGQVDLAKAQLAMALDWTGAEKMLGLSRG